QRQGATLLRQGRVHRTGVSHIRGGRDPQRRCGPRADALTARDSAQRPTVSNRDSARSRDVARRYFLRQPPESISSAKIASNCRPELRTALPESYSRTASTTKHGALDRTEE